jgi:hypothetical protein
MTMGARSTAHSACQKVFQFSHIFAQNEIISALIPESFIVDAQASVSVAVAKYKQSTIDAVWLDVHGPNNKVRRTHESVHSLGRLQ